MVPIVSSPSFAIARLLLTNQQKRKIGQLEKRLSSPSILVIFGEQEICKFYIGDDNHIFTNINQNYHILHR